MDHMEYSIAIPPKVELTNAGAEWVVMKQRHHNHLNPASVPFHQSSPSLFSSFLINLSMEQMQEAFNVLGLTINEALRFDKILKNVEDFCLPRFLIIYNRFRFFMCKQNGPEFNGFLQQLLAWSDLCEFGELKDILLKDCIISGISEESVRQRLLRTEKLDFNKTVEICKAGLVKHHNLDISKYTDNKRLDAWTETEEVESIFYQINQSQPAMLDKSVGTTSTPFFDKETQVDFMNEINMLDCCPLQLVGDPLNIESAHNRHDDCELNRYLNPRMLDGHVTGEAYQDFSEMHDRFFQGFNAELSSITTSDITHHYNEYTGNLRDCHYDQNMEPSSGLQNLHHDIQPAHSQNTTGGNNFDNQVIQNMNHYEDHNHDHNNKTLLFNETDHLSQNINEGNDYNNVHLYAYQNSLNISVNDSTHQILDISERITSYDKDFSIQGYQHVINNPDYSVVAMNRESDDIQTKSVNQQNAGNSSQETLLPTVTEVLNVDIPLKAFVDNSQAKVTTENSLLSHHLNPSVIENSFKDANKIVDDSQRLQNETIVKDNENKHKSFQKKFSCNFCKAAFNKRSHLIVHTRLHTGERPFVCDQCGKSYTEASKLKCHLRNHTDIRPYKCSDCSMTFKWSAALRRHLRTHSGDKPFKCTMCDSSFPDQTALNRHLKRAHKLGKKYECTCGVSFNDSSALNIHKRIHTGERSYKCSICGASFVRSQHLKYHLKVHSGEKGHECKVCHAKFTEASRLKEHSRKHTGEKPYVCTLCGKSFKWSATFLRHKKTHTQEKSYLCQICNRSYVDKSSLLRHKRTHSGEKPYQCTECLKSFSDPASFKRHKVIHSGVKQYSCSVCGMSFALKWYLTQHQKIHSDKRPYTCSFCDMSFHTSTQLKRHNNKHHTNHDQSKLSDENSVVPSSQPVPFSLADTSFAMEQLIPNSALDPIQGHDLDQYLTKPSDNSIVSSDDRSLTDLNNVAVTNSMLDDILDMRS